MSGQITDSLGQKLLQILNQLTSAGSAVLYLPVRLTDGSNFYAATGGGGGSSVVQIKSSSGSGFLLIDSTGKIGINNFPSNYPDSSADSTLSSILTALSSVGVTSLPSNYQSYIRWGIPREPAWVDGSETTAPAAGTALVSKTVSSGKTGRVFGVHIAAPEANRFQLQSGGSVIKDFTVGIEGVIHIVLPLPLLNNVAAGTAITINNVTAGASGAVYQASLLYDEA
jgi:hypothetical protein